MKRQSILSILPLLLLSTFISAQKVDINQLSGIKMRNIGPAGMSGRVTAIDVVHNNTDKIYIGTASGGVWVSESGGIDWKPIFDKQPVQSIGALTINQQNPAEIWVGTGEGNPRNSHDSGEGIFKSIDGGHTWKRMGLEKTKTIHRIIIDKHNTNVVYAAALGSAWGPNPERGVFKTTDGGKTWEKILYINDSTGCADFIVDPSNPNKLIAAMWEYGRKPWFFNSGGKGSGIYISHDGGTNWKKVQSKDGIPRGNLGRIGLAIAPSKPNVVYALIEAKENGFYRSDNGGRTWRKQASKNIGNRPFYYADIFVDSKNENRVFNLYSLLSMSEDGGKTFRVILPYSKIHPDHHAFWIHPENPNYMINGNDGGLNISRDGGKTWRFIENLPLAQFYHINYDMDFPYNVYGGMQDNGSWVGPAYVFKRGGIRNSDFQELYFGDGFDVVPRPDNNRYVYAMSQGGNVAYIDRETGHNRFIKPFHPDGEKLRFHWNAGIAQNPFHNCGIYFGSQYVHKSMDCGETWEIISPDLTTNDSTKQKQHLSGGLTIDDTRAENHTTIITIAPSPRDEQVIWVGTDDGNVQLTRDGGKTWNNLSSRLPGFRKGSWIPQIEVSPMNKGEAFVVVNDYRRNNWQPYLYHTSDYGQTWKRIADANNIHGHCLAVVQDPVEENLLFLGTEFGLYVSIDKGRTWSKWMNGYPSTPTRDLKIHPREHDLIVGTFGRAVWIMDDIRPLRELARTQGETLKKDFKLFDIPDAYMASYRSVDGTRFAGDAMYIGANRGSGARMTVWVHPKLKKKKKESPKVEDKKKGKKKKGKKKMAEAEKEKAEGEADSASKKDKKDDTKKRKGDKAEIKVFNMQGDTLRTYEVKLDTGINRIGWNMRRKGVRFPTYREIKPDAAEPGGPQVLPGKYMIKIWYKDFKDSATVQVHTDPRREVSVTDLQAKSAAIDDFYNLVENCSDAMNQLKDAKKTIDLVNDGIWLLPDSTQKDIKEAGKEMLDSIKVLQKLYALPPGTKGIQRVVDGLNSSLYTANGYIYASKGAPSQNARHALAAARKDASEVLTRINNFIANDWAEYQKKVETANFSLFKKFEPVKME